MVLHLPGQCPTSGHHSPNWRCHVDGSCCLACDLLADAERARTIETFAVDEKRFRRHLADVLKCYLGLSDEKPKFGRFNWIEKLEYYAVVWGTTVMVLTGLALWFEAQALTYLPLWVWHIC